MQWQWTDNVSITLLVSLEWMSTSQYHVLHVFHWLPQHCCISCITSVCLQMLATRLAAAWCVVWYSSRPAAMGPVPFQFNELIQRVELDDKLILYPNYECFINFLYICSTGPTKNLCWSTFDKMKLTTTALPSCCCSIPAALLLCVPIEVPC